VAASRWLLLLRWRDPREGFEMWEPPGGGLEPGEGFEAAARRELREEAGLEAPALTGPTMVARDFRWNGARRVGEEAFFLAEWDDVPSVRLERDPALLEYRWVEEPSVSALGAVEPPDVLAVLSRLRRARPSPPSR
jgi:ADP-ribose pyrophosphatase YjhB (NUDIX family)